MIQLPHEWRIVVRHDTTMTVRAFWRRDAAEKFAREQLTDLGVSDLSVVEADEDTGSNGSA